MFPSCHVDPNTCNDASPMASVGQFYVWSDQKGGTAPSGIYRYTRAEDGALANGDVLEFADATGTEVTWDRSGGSSVGKACAGVAVGTVTDARYTYVLVWGVHTAVKTDGGVSAGDFLVPHTVDKQADTMADGEEEQVFGMALADDDSDSIVTAIVRCY